MDEQASQPFQFGQIESERHRVLRRIIGLMLGVSVCLLAGLTFAGLSLALPSRAEHVPWLFFVPLEPFLALVVGAVVGGVVNAHIISVRCDNEKWSGPARRKLFQFGMQGLLLAMVLAALFVWIGKEYWVTWGPQVALFWFALAAASSAVTYPFVLWAFRIMDGPTEPATKRLVKD